MDKLKFLTFANIQIYKVKLTSFVRNVGSFNAYLSAWDVCNYSHYFHPKLLKVAAFTKKSPCNRRKKVPKIAVAISLQNFG